MNKKKIYLKIGLDYLIAAAIFGFVIFVLPKLLSFFMPFVIGYIISVISDPIVKFLEQKVKIVRKLGSAFIIALVIFLVFFAVYWIISTIIYQAIDMIDNVPQTLVTIKNEIYRLGDKMTNLYDKMPPFIQRYMLKIKSSFNNVGTSEGESIINIGTASSAVRNVMEVILASIFTILSAYFFTVDKEKISLYKEKYVPCVMNEKLKLITIYFTTAVGGYIKAQFKLMLIMVAIMFVTFEIMDVDYSFLISLGIGILDFLPVFGTGAVLWPWTAYCLLTGSYARAIILVVLYIACQLTKQFLQPKVVGDSIGISPLATLILLFIGYKIGGIIGILIALPAGLIMINLYRAGTFDVLIDDTLYIIDDISQFCKNNKIRREH